MIRHMHYRPRLGVLLLLFGVLIWDVNNDASAQAPPERGTMQPPLVVNAQYIKSLSLAVPGAPLIYTKLHAAPKVVVNLDVISRRVLDGQDVFEVSLSIRAVAHPAETAEQLPASAAGVSPPADVVFVVELTYCGVVTLKGLPESAIEPVLLVEAPRFLFPFAREVLANVTRDDGFPPMLLQPVDFVAMWQAQRATAENKAKQ